jgi:hypothetical protein
LIPAPPAAAEGMNTAAVILPSAANRNIGFEWQD